MLIEVSASYGSIFSKSLRINSNCYSMKRGSTLNISKIYAYDYIDYLEEL